MTYVDLPAACLALAGVALFVRSCVTRDDRVLYAAAGVLALAALTREILVYLIVLAALSALFQPVGKRLRRATPWLLALGVFALGYAAHVWAVEAYVAGRVSTLNYLQGSPAFALDAVTRFSNYITAGPFLLPLLVLLGALGAWAAAKQAGVPFSAFSAVAILVPIVAMAKLGNPGIDASGQQVNYWGNLIIPLALSLWPVALLLLPES